eukprot:symbB.v1.2.040933.t1/scaffold7665.1/size9999/1
MEVSVDSCKKIKRDTNWQPRDGCPVGACLCDVSQLQELFAAFAEATAPERWTRPKAVKDYNGRKAVHLTIEGASCLCSGQAPEALAELLRRGAVEFLPGLRLGAQAYRGQAVPTAPLPATPESPFTFVELFAGIGGFRWALQDLGGQCVFASEVDVDCQETYARNFGSEHLYGDITCVHAEEVPQH